MRMAPSEAVSCLACVSRAPCMRLACVSTVSWNHRSAPAVGAGHPVVTCCLLSKIDAGIDRISSCSV